MPDHQADIVIAGAGLSAALTALRLGRTARVVLVDRKPDPRAAHTWSFHAGDIPADAQAWLAPALRCRWPGQEVLFPGYGRRLRAGYASLDSHSLGQAVADVPHVRGEVARIDPEGVTLACGRRIAARVALDARGFAPHPALEIRFQKFLGQELRLAGPHGPAWPVIMDATVPQQDGYRFFYLLPFAPDRLLVEATHYADAAALPAETLRHGIAAYVAAQGWTVAQVLREETGVLPIALRFDAPAFWRDRDPDLPVIGLRAGRFHPLTGYSLPCAVRSAEIVHDRWRQGPRALAQALRRDSLDLAQAQGFYRMLARMLFLAAEPEGRRAVMARFYRLPEGLIERFYAGRSTLPDKARILMGKPPVPIRRALPCVPERLGASL